MRPSVRAAAEMARANPVRTALLTVAPLAFAVVQTYFGVTSASPRSLVGVAFAAALVAYSAAAFRVHLAEHRVESLGGLGPEP